MGGVPPDEQPALGESQLRSGAREPDVRPAPTLDMELLAGGSALHVPAEAVAEFVGPNHNRPGIPGRRVELGGLEPPAFWLPARRSSQLSYSPVEFEVGG